MKKGILILLLLACASIACAQSPQDVPKDHWAYESVNYLLGKGYILGNPDGSFGGNRTLTRYEFATIINRIIHDMDSRMPAEADAGKPTTTGKAERVAPAVTKDDLEQISKLINEFKPELLVIGARLDKVEAALCLLQSTVDKVNATLTDPRGAFATMKSDVSKLKKVAVSGWVQMRYNAFQGDLNSPTASKPPSNFNTRRSRIKVAGKPTDNATVVIQYDAGQNYQGTTAPAISLKDAYVEYDFAGDSSRGLGLIFGQTLWPFGYEVPQSDTVRESPERALIIQRLFPGERDRGLYATYPFLNGKAVWKLGVFNGVQTSMTPPTDAKAGVSTLRFKYGDVDFGASAWYGKDVESSTGTLYFNNKAPKTRYGADVEWYLSNLTLKAEYVVGVGVDGADSTKTFNSAVLNQSVNGGWAQAAWNFTKQDTLAVKYETMSDDPLYPTFGRRSAWDLGLLHWLDEKNRVKLYYIINQEENHSFPNNAYIAEWVSVF